MSFTNRCSMFVFSTGTIERDTRLSKSGACRKLLFVFIIVGDKRFTQSYNDHRTISNRFLVFIYLFFKFLFYYSHLLPVVI